MDRNKGYKTHDIGLVMYMVKCFTDNILLWNTSLYQLLHTTEIVTRWESSIAVLMKVVNMHVFC